MIKNKEVSHCDGHRILVESNTVLTALANYNNALLD